MTPKQALETLEGVEHHGSLGDAGDALRAVLQRDWARRAMDEWHLLAEENLLESEHVNGAFHVTLWPDGHVFSNKEHTTAFMAAALSILDELPDAARERLKEGA